MPTDCAIRMSLQFEYTFVAYNVHVSSKRNRMPGFVLE